MSKVREIITEKIIEKLEQGTIPWRQPWSDRWPENYFSRKRYRGMNLLLLYMQNRGCPYWATFKQIKGAGGTIKKDSESAMVVYYKTKTINVEKVEKNKEGVVQRDSNGDPLTWTTHKEIPMTRYYRVFNIEDTDLPVPNKDQEKPQVLTSAQDVWESWDGRPGLKKANKCFYFPLFDYIGMVPIEDFDTPEHHSAVWFHEMIHATGHSSRLDRLTSSPAAFGSEDYSKEELVAEIGSAILLSKTDITIDWENTSAYIKGWLSKLRNDKNIIFQAASKADKAVSLILGEVAE